MTIMTAVHNHASSRRAKLGVECFGAGTVDRAVLFASHAECPNCRAYVRTLTQLDARSAIGELIEGWCSVCGTSTFFLLAS